MKYGFRAFCLQKSKSRPARGGWIEIAGMASRLPYQEGPAPQGAGGLKFAADVLTRYRAESRPARGGWIEILKHLLLFDWAKSRPARGGWIEILLFQLKRSQKRSRPARGGWIEISKAF